MQTRQPTRRTFLHYALASTAGLGLLGPTGSLRAQTARGRTAPYDVLIIGAGLSGLHAAQLLESQGARVAVLEARERVGGRVFTLDDVPGRPEAGGNALGPSYARCLAQVRRLGLELGPMRTRSDPGVDATTIHYRDAVISDTDWSTSAVNPFSGDDRKSKPWELQWSYYLRNNPLRAPGDWLDPAHAKFDVPIYDLARGWGLGNAAAQLAFDRCQLYGTGAFDVSALHLFHIINVATHARQSFGPEQYAIAAGNQRLPEAMAATLEGDLHFGQAVLGIRDGVDAVEVRTHSGARYRARHVIVTPPAPALRNVLFDPVLPPAHARGIAQLGYSVGFQVHFEARSRFWEQDGRPLTMWTDGPLGRLTGLYYGESREDPTTIISFVNGARALVLDRMPQEAAVAYLLEHLATLRPSTRGQLRPLKVISWQQDPYAGGTYSSFRPGQVTAFARALAEPVGRVHFAGEHTAAIHRGMEGAMESGERVALEVLQVLA